MKILIIRFSALGDIVLLSGVLKHIYEEYQKKYHDTISIDLLTSDSFKYLVEKYLPNIANTIIANSDNEIKQISKNSDYDYVFDLHTNRKSALFTKNYKNKVYKYNSNKILRRIFVTFKLFSKKLNKHVTNKYAEIILKTLKLPLSKEAIKPFLLSKNIDSNNFNLIATNPVYDNYKPILVFHPFASKKTKYLENIQDHIDSLSKDYNIILVGSNIANINNFINCINLVDKTSIEQLINIINLADRVVSTDSGILFISIGLSKPVTGLFGPTSYGLGFYPKFENVKIIEKNLACRPCHVHGSDRCPKKHHHCMKLKPLTKNILEK